MDFDSSGNFGMLNSKLKLEEWIGKDVKYFAYPSGNSNEREKKILEKYGFELATTTENKPISHKNNLFFIPRYWVRGAGFFAEAKCQIVGICTPTIRKIEKLLRIKAEDVLNY